MFCSGFDVVVRFLRETSRKNGVVFAFLRGFYERFVPYIVLCSSCFSMEFEEPKMRFCIGFYQIVTNDEIWPQLIPPSFFFFFSFYVMVDAFLAI